MIPKGYIRVSKRRPCPVCGKPDYCLISSDGQHAGCTRTELGCDRKDGQPVMVAVSEPTYRFTLNGSIAATGLSLPKPRPVVHINAAAIHTQLRAAITAPQLKEVADSLGVSQLALDMLGIGWHEGLRAFSFPMHDERARIIGIRLRRPEFKFSVEGSHNGMFLPSGAIPKGGPVLVVEGPTDAAAAIDWGFYEVIGRPNASACVEMLVAALRGRNVVILANFDQPKRRIDKSVFYPGQEGAAKLADALVAGGTAVKVIYPTDDIKDARAWKQAGATRARVDAVIRNAKFWTRKATA